MIKHPDGFHIHLSTIHGVKGETHDATLVMETKNRSYDIEQLLNNIAYLDVAKITQKTKSKFSRQLYVAVSRPRHLLCIAVHSDRISQPQRDALDNLGWCLIDLS
jgi:DNA helicase-2/ATP-dependent DNA helicase PcrA